MRSAHRLVTKGKMSAARKEGGHAKRGATYTTLGTTSLSIQEQMAFGENEETEFR